MKRHVQDNPVSSDFFFNAVIGTEERSGRTDTRKSTGAVLSGLGENTSFHFFTFIHRFDKICGLLNVCWIPETGLALSCVVRICYFCDRSINI